MNADAHATLQVPLSLAQTLLQMSASGLQQYADSLRPLRTALAEVDALGNVAAKKAAARIRRQLDQFEPSITMIGQIKSGKTTLVNSMIGEADLLPADVNPWTSVVTSLHMVPRELTPPCRARFRFFEDGEWDRLVTGGGRIGELANRAGADDELAKIKEQIAIMREKTKARLGRKFEMLLGKEHSYGYFDQELVERYVCLGDDFGDDAPATKNQGRFADITKSADLYFHQPAYPINLCIRDTPGVNDTFMIREQITIKSIRDSRICVVVLSAHQALSSTDLALIRLISNVKTREVIVFVNRIDELSDPATQVPEIRDSIRKTLKDHKGPEEAEVIFGSALWANRAGHGSIADLPKDSQQALLNWAEARADLRVSGREPEKLMWVLSGLPVLTDAIAARIAEGPGQDLIEQSAVATANLLNGIKMSDNLEEKQRIDGVRLRVTTAELRSRIDQTVETAQAALDAQLDQLEQNFEQRVDRAHQTFLGRATEALAKHLEFYGEQSAWTYDPSGLRILLNSAYKIHGTKCQGAFMQCAQQALTGFRAIYEEALGLPPALFDPQVPPAPRIAPPVSLGQTIAMDLRGSWWKGWWTRRKTYDAQAAAFHDLIKAETDTLVHDLTADQAKAITAAMRGALQAFLADQAESLGSLTDHDVDTSTGLRNLFGVDELAARARSIDTALAALKGMQHAE